MKYKDWKNEYYSSLVDNDKLFVCCQCMCQVKHRIIHWLKYHRRDEE